MEIPNGHRFQSRKIYDRNSALDIGMENEDFIGYVLTTTKLSQAQPLDIYFSL